MLVFFLNGTLGFLRYNQNSILELIVNVCRDCVISTDKCAVSFINSFIIKFALYVCMFLCNEIKKRCETVWFSWYVFI